jgi:hypothetical protein
MLLKPCKPSGVLIPGHPKPSAASDDCRWKPGSPAGLSLWNADAVKKLVGQPGEESPFLVRPGALSPVKGLRLTPGRLLEAPVGI